MISFNTLLHLMKKTTCQVMKILPFKAVYPNLDNVPHSNDFFDTVKFRYQEYTHEQLFNTSESEAIYIYQIKNKDKKKSTGLVTCTDIADYFEGKMKKHERTIIANEQLQSELLNTRGAAIKPVLLTHPSVSELDELITNYLDHNKKFYVIELGGEKHRFWQITEPELVQKIQQIFEQKIPYTYIADGHHRSASFATLHEKKPTDKTTKMLTAYFPMEELEIKEHNRMISDLNGMTPDSFLEKLMDLFKVKVLKKGVKPYAKLEMTMYLDNKWFQLNWRKSVLKGFADGLVLLDAHLLNEKILKPILDIKNVRDDARVEYIDGTKDIEDIEKTLKKLPTDGVVFCLYRVEMEDLITIVDSNGVLPPKSTFFEPRMKNGLLVYEI